MEKLQMCRICLVKDVRMYVVVNKNLHELYENLTDVPFVTEDSRPMLACFFCCTKLKQCWQFQRKCLEAEELFTQMMNEDYELDPLMNPGHLKFLCGFSTSPVELISIIGGGQIESSKISERVEDNIDPEEEKQSEEIKLKIEDMSCPDGKDIPMQQHHAESNSKYEVPLMEIKTELVEEQEPIEPKLENVENNHSDEETSALHAEPDSYDVPLMEIKTEVEELSGASVAKKKPTLHSRRSTPGDTISAGNYQKFAFVSQIKKIQNHSSNRTTKRKKSLGKSQHADDSSIYNIALGISCRESSVKDDNKCMKSNKLVDSDEKRHRKKRFNCVNCQKSFTEKGLIRHARIHTGEKPFQCDICQRSFGQKSYLVNHMPMHASKKPFKCDICQSSFRLKHVLMSHIRTHTGEKPFKCEICQRSFSNKNNLIRHNRTHTGEKPFKCDICPTSFSQKGDLTKHNLMHTDEEKPFKCDICLRGFNTKSYLNSHIRTHTGEKPFKCDICRRTFNEKSHLTKHIRTHTGERPYKCDICQIRFRQKSNLNRHVRNHTGQKPFKCDICQRAFSVKYHLIYHISTHTGEKPFKCDICTSGFSTKYYLMSHIIRTHKGEKPFKSDIKSDSE